MVVGWRRGLSTLPASSTEEVRIKATARRDPRRRKVTHTAHFLAPDDPEELLLPDDPLAAPLLDELFTRPLLQAAIHSF